MSSLFPDDRRPAEKRSSFRRFPPRPKVADTEPKPLEDGWILAHCDGGSRGNPGPAGFGAVLVDTAGEPLAEMSEFLGVRTNNFAEYSGFLAVLAWALEHGYPKLRVISDSELMVKQVQGKYKVNSPDLRPLFEEARRRILQFEKFEILHALRHKNKTADRLANEAMDRGTGKSVPVPPTSRTEVPSSAQKQAAAPAPTRQTVQRDVSGSVLRGFVREGVVHLLGGQTLPENSFVKITPE